MWANCISVLYVRKLDMLRKPDMWLDIQLIHEKTRYPDDMWENKIFGRYVRNWMSGWYVKKPDIWSILEKSGFLVYMWENRFSGWYVGKQDIRMIFEETRYQVDIWENRISVVSQGNMKPAHLGYTSMDILLLIVTPFDHPIQEIILS